MPRTWGVLIYRPIEMSSIVYCEWLISIFEWELYSRYHIWNTHWLNSRPICSLSQTSPKTYFYNSRVIVGYALNVQLRVTFCSVKYYGIFSSLHEYHAVSTFITTSSCECVFSYSSLAFRCLAHDAWLSSPDDSLLSSTCSCSLFVKNSFLQPTASASVSSSCVMGAWVWSK